MGSCREEPHQPARVIVVSTRVFCLINDFAVRAGHTKGKVQHLAVVPLEAQLLLKALTEEVSEAGEKKKHQRLGRFQKV